MRASSVVAMIMGLLSVAASAAEPKPAPVVPAAPRPAQPEPVTFEKLSFADEKLQQQARRFHDWGQKLAQVDGAKGLYVPERTSPKSTSVTYNVWWSRGDDVKEPIRNSHKVRIRLEGPRKEGVERLHYLLVVAEWKPLDVWGAQVEYLVDPRTKDPSSKGPPRRAIGAHVRKPGHVNDAGNPIDPVSPYIAVSVNEQRDVRYSVKIDGTKHREFADSLALFYGKPEAMRDTLLADIAELRKQNVKHLAGLITVYDARNASSDNPPREMPVFSGDGLPSAATQKALAEGVEKQFLALEETLRADYLAIHAAIQKALPLRDLLEDAPE